MWWIAAIGAAAMAKGSMDGAKSESRQLYASADQDKIQGKYAIDKSMVHAKLIRKLAKETVGAARAGYAASGVKVDSGSAMEAEREIFETSERDAEYALLTGRREFKAYQESAKGKYKAAKDAKRGGLLGGLGSALSAFGGK